MQTQKDNIPKLKLLADALEKIEQAKQIISSNPPSYLKSLNLEEKFNGISDVLKTMNRKPVIGFFGHFDAGKSTLINTIINQDILPTKYQPATCVVNLLMHINDKPSNFLGSVALFKKGFKPYMIHDKKEVDKYLIEQGDISILDKLGIHNHNSSSAVPNEAYIAIVFSNASILNQVWLLDTPGDLNSSDDSDTEKALGGVELADGIVFISNHTGFFKDSDLGFATNIIRQKPPINPNEPTNHLLFVQSHCHDAITHKDVVFVGQAAFKRIQKQLEELIFISWKDDNRIEKSPTSEQMTARVQPFWRENNEFCTQTLSKIHELSDYLISNQQEILKSNINGAVKRLNEILLSAASDLENRKQDSLKRIREVENLDARFRTESEKLVKEFKDLITSCNVRKKEDTDLMKDFFENKVSSSSLERLIKETYSSKQEAQSEIGSYVGQSLTVRLETLLKTSGKAISNEVDMLLNRWQKAVSPKNMLETNTVYANVDIADFDISAFNSKAAFIGGLASLGSLGAMSFYISTITSNLGAYILVGRVAGLLVRLGLVANVTSVTSFVAALGGPITLGIALASAIGLFVYRLFGGSWQKSLADNVAEAIRNENVWSKTQSSITDFWDKTYQAMNFGLEELIQETNKYFDGLKEDAIKEYDIEQLDDCIKTIQKTTNFLIIK
jgi:hypothetical protein